ncbi:hypothetical protein BGW38_008056, partial [Lunasporangiospora selenospora]
FPSNYYPTFTYPGAPKPTGNGGGGGGDNDKSSSNNTALYAGIGGGIGALVLALGIFFFIRHKRKSKDVNVAKFDEVSSSNQHGGDFQQQQNQHQPPPPPQQQQQALPPLPPMQQVTQPNQFPVTHQQQQQQFQQQLQQQQHYPYQDPSVPGGNYYPTVPVTTTVPIQHPNPSPTFAPNVSAAGGPVSVVPMQHTSHIQQPLEQQNQHLPYNQHTSAINQTYQSPIPMPTQAHGQVYAMSSPATTVLTSMTSPTIYDPASQQPTPHQQYKMPSEATPPTGAIGPRPIVANNPQYVGPEHYTIQGAQSNNPQYIAPPNTDNYHQ